MKIILVEDIKKLGKKGDVLDVKDGQARNYLIPNNLAIEANKKNLNALNSKNKLNEPLSNDQSNTLIPSFIKNSLYLEFLHISPTSYPSSNACLAKCNL